MIRFIVFPALVSLSLPYWPQLIPIRMIAVCLFFATLFLFNRYTRLASCILLGLFWTNLVALDYATSVKQINQSRAYITINGEITSLISEKKLAKNIIFFTDPINLLSSSTEKSYRLRLFWKEPPRLAQGQRWQLKVKLKPVVSRLNGVGFDAERFYLAQHIHANAHVVQGSLLADRHTLRQRFYDYIDAKLLKYDVKHRDFILALSFAVRDFLSAQTKQQLRDSGLLHLLAISGLHIGLAIFFFCWLGSKLSVILDTGDRFYTSVWIISLVGALLYAWLAGFTLSSQRAIVMGSVGLWYRNKGVPLTSYQPWLLSFSICLLLDPLASFSLSLYLSYFVVLILLIMGHFSIQSMTEKKGKYRILSTLFRYFRLLLFLQIFLFIFMLPLQLTVFSGIAYLSPVFNLLMVPWVSFICVPLIFLCLLFPIAPIVCLTDLSFTPVILLLPYAQGHWLLWHQIQAFLIESLPNSGTLDAGIMLCSILLLSFILFRRYMFLIGSFILLSYLVIRPNLAQKSEWKFSVLDVGHGLSVVIEKNREAIVYDVGRSWESGSIAQSVVVPYLQRSLISHLDGLILSHDDNDHAGGWEYLQYTMQPTWKRAASNRADFSPCIRGEKWVWNEVDFEALWPLRLTEKAYNEDSCVIKITYNGDSLLLTGDIENIAQYYLLNFADDISANVAILPHHGSPNATNSKWVNRLQADIVINSSSKLSRWERPHPKVIGSYSRAGTWVLDVADHGRIDVIFNRNKLDLKMAREHDSPFWYRHLLN